MVFQHIQEKDLNNFITFMWSNIGQVLSGNSQIFIYGMNQKSLTNSYC